MAFDPQTYAPFYDATDFATIEANYLRSSLLAGSAACIANDISEWEDHGAMPSDEVFREVEPFYNDEEPTDPETAATFLLLVREAVRY
ncbi:hypothetical protein [Variovorax sp. PBL-E5]|uniref:hypothetical protein n=1 Tax=Variovorax sp. PBL-E5 TaxID=434014 RepID=UPI0013176F5B|nr:hypothetical protein [Variovorax sp. PBL-E5]VTU29912.1 hypothetical protein E5CHR_02907 [Variovorax sp. PBL-E5]